MALAKSGELIHGEGGPNWGSSEAAVDAYRGKLPAGKQGYEFTTPVQPRDVERFGDVGDRVEAGCDAAVLIAADLPGVAGAGALGEFGSPSSGRSTSSRMASGIC
jgi:hypothetical protein